MHKCNTTILWERNGGEKQKQRKHNGKREPTTIYIESPPTRHTEDIKKRTETAKQHNQNTQQQHEQKNEHTVLHTESAKMHQKKHSKKAEHILNLPKPGSTRKVMYMLPKKRKAQKGHGQDACGNANEAKPKRWKKSSLPMSC